MAEAGNPEDLSVYLKEIDMLRKENESLRMQNEIELLEKQLLKLQTTSNIQTPRNISPNTSFRSQTKRQLPHIPERKIIEKREQLSNTFLNSEPRMRFSTPMTDSKTHSNTFKSEQEDRDLSPEIWDRHVTRRRKSQREIDDENMKSDTSTKINSNRSSVFMKPATFDGSWLDYKAHFDACCEINRWSEKQKGFYLAVSLCGQAQGVFGNLGTKDRSFNELVKALEERFAPPNQTELYRVQLRERKQKPSESLSEMGQEIRRLTNLAYPSVPSDVRETLAKEQFIDSLFSSDMRLRIKQARPVNLNDAVRHAEELEAFHRAERRTTDNKNLMRTVTMVGYYVIAHLLNAPTWTIFSSTRRSHFFDSVE